MTASRLRRVPFAPRSIPLLLLGAFALSPTLRAQTPPTISANEITHRMVQAEGAAWNNREHLLYKNTETSNRTNGHVWSEWIIETSDGPLQRLFAIDGRPLSKTQQAAEDHRIAHLADHPFELRATAQRRRKNEARMPELLAEVPGAFLFRILSVDGNYTRIAFEPNPSFRERSYQDRIVHAMGGKLLIHTPDMRLSELDAHLEHNVFFGFGLLGVLNHKTHFSLTRKEVFLGQWTTTKVHIHLDGSVLLLKSLSRDLDSSHSEFRPVAHDLTVPQGAAIVRSITFR